MSGSLQFNIYSPKNHLLILIVVWNPLIRIKNHWRMTNILWTFFLYPTPQYNMMMQVLTHSLTSLNLLYISWNLKWTTSTTSGMNSIMQTEYRKLGSITICVTCLWQTIWSELFIEITSQDHWATMPTFHLINLIKGWILLQLRWLDW